MGKSGADGVRAKAENRRKAAVMEEDVFAKQEKLFATGTEESPSVE